MSRTCNLSWMSRARRFLSCCYWHNICHLVFGTGWSLDAWAPLQSIALDRGDQQRYGGRRATRRRSQQRNHQGRCRCCALNFCHLVLSTCFGAIAGWRNSAKEHPLQNHVRTNLCGSDPHQHPHCSVVLVLQPLTSTAGLWTTFRQDTRGICLLVHRDLNVVHMHNTCYMHI